MRILITGSRGFIGGSFARFAASEGHEVLGLGRASQPDPDWPGSYVQTDVAHTDLSSIFDKFAPGAVLHAAGTASVGGSFPNPLDDLRAAVVTLANTLDGIRRSRQRPIILFPSSAAVYGNPATLPVAEDAPVAPLSPYGFHKAMCELIANEYACCFGLSILCCRLFSVFGERQRRLLVWELYRQFAGAQDTVWLEGLGSESRDYLHMDDVSALMLRLMLRPPPESMESGFSSINLASGKETTVKALAERLGNLVAPNKAISFRGIPRLGDPVQWVADTGRLRKEVLGWQPKPLDDRLRECVRAWATKQP